MGACCCLPGHRHKDKDQNPEQLRDDARRRGGASHSRWGQACSCILSFLGYSQEPQSHSRKPSLIQSDQVQLQGQRGLGHLASCHLSQINGRHPNESEAFPRLSPPTHVPKELTCHLPSLAGSSPLALLGQAARLTEPSCTTGIIFPIPTNPGSSCLVCKTSLSCSWHVSPP